MRTRGRPQNLLNIPPTEGVLPSGGVFCFRRSAMNALRLIPGHCIAKDRRSYR
jgi:hypothetical protein